MLKTKINYLLIIIVLVVAGVYLNYSIDDFLSDISDNIFNADIINKITTKEIIVFEENEDNNKIDENYNNPLDEIFFEGAKVYYWNFVGSEQPYDFEKRTNKDGNFYIKSVPYGAGLYINVAVFRNNKTIFKREMIWKGRAFISWRDNSLNIIEGREYDGSCCPKEWLLTKYKYNSETDTIDEVETKIYAGGEVRPIGPNIVPLIIYPYTNYPKELEDFEEDNTIEVFEL
ncbi:hypothetical protein KJ854_03215 [Patescibacteria group bacterium]|nr:hypothetical protein [Patescibacteria group bacterium]